METKKEIMEKIKRDIKIHFQPKVMNKRSKKELEDLYNEAKRLNLFRVNK